MEESCPASSRFPRDLLEAFSTGEVLAVVGAGLSVAAGLPSWETLVSRMITYCELHVPQFSDATELRSMLAHDLLPDVADECRTRMGNALFANFLFETFRSPEVRPAALHAALYRLPCQGILTTNYDTLLEQAYADTHPARRVPPVFTHENIPQLARIAGERGFFILKLHGHIDDVSSIVLTSSDYKRLIERHDAYRLGLTSLFSTRTLLFMGYGLEDEDLKIILKEHASVFKNFGRRHFALVADPGPVRQRNLQERFNISVIPYSGKASHAEFPDLLRALGEAIRQFASHAGPAWMSEDEREQRRVRSVMAHEREICQSLDMLIPLERARYLQRHANSALLSKPDIDLIGRSIEAGEAPIRQLELVQEQLRQAQKLEAVGRLAGGVAHDFNNLLMVISSYAEMLQGRLEPNSKFRRNTQQILKAAEKAASLTRQLLAFSRKQVMATQVMDLNSTIDDTAKMVKRLIGENIELEFLPGESLPRIEADPDQITQVLLNLCVNARDAMPEGGVLTIETQSVKFDEGSAIREPDIAAGRFVLLAVTDTGTGMTKEVQAHIFDPFFTTKERGKGTGLGLATVYGIVKQSGGHIRFSSEIGRGTCFKVYFPASDKIDAEKTMVANAGSGQGETILVAEDEDALRCGVCEFLREHGYQVLEGADGEDALNVAEHHQGPIHLLLSDVIMPKMSGPELANRLRRLPNRQDILIVYMSGYSDEAIEHGVQKNEAEFIPKPFSLDGLLHKLQKVLGAKAKSATP